MVNLKVLKIKLRWNIGIFICENAHFRFKPSTGSVKSLHLECPELIELNINSKQSIIIIKLRMIPCNIEKNVFYRNFRFYRYWHIAYSILYRFSHTREKFGAKIISISWAEGSTSGLDFRPEVKNMTLHQFRVRPIYPQSFMQIGPRVSE